MFWQILVKLCNENSTTPTAMVKELGIAGGSVTRWKNGSVPHGTNLQKIADYFNVSVDVLLGKEPLPDEQNKKPDAENDELLLKSYEIMKKLPEDAQKQALSYLAFLQADAEKHKNSSSDPQ